MKLPEFPQKLVLSFSWLLCKQGFNLLQSSLKLPLDKRKFFFQSDSRTSLLTNLFRQSDVLPFFTQHDRFFFLSDLSANKSNCKLFCFSMWYCKLLSLWGKVQLCHCKSIIKNCNKFIWSIFLHLVFTILYYSFIYIYDVLWIVNFNFEFLDS